jgi:kynurenine formamidase
MALADRTPPTPEEYLGYFDRFCNWGRWGDNDELGAVNHVTPETQRQAAQLVRDGRTVGMGRALDTKPGEANPFPAHHFIAVDGSGGMLDYFGMFIHGLTCTHIDALCHLANTERITWNGKKLGNNGMPVEHSGTIDFLVNGIATRGVLYDVPRYRGTDYVEPGSPVHGWELQDIATASRITPRPGDAVIIRSGWDDYWRINERKPPFSSVTGVHASALEFLYETDASVLVWDFQDAPTADQGLPNPTRVPTMAIAQHVHVVALVYMGMPIIDNAALDDLAKACADANRWEFMFTVAPLNIPRATGSPVNPLAIF